VLGPNCFRTLMKCPLVQRVLAQLAQGVIALALVLTFVAQSSARENPKAAARVHFEKGVAAFNDRRYADAAEAFNTAYRLSPAYVVLYNIGQVNVALGNSVAAVDAFEAYLKQGASSISEERQKEVQAEVEEQRGRIGTVFIISHPEDADVRVDGRLVGTTPLSGPLRLNAGHHTIEAIRADRAPQIRELEIAGKALITLEFAFETASPAVSGLEVAEGSLTPAAGVSSEREVSNGPADTQAADAQQVNPKLVPQSSKQAPEREAESGSFNWLRAVGIAVTVAGVGVGTYGAVKVIRGVSRASEKSDQLAATETPEQYDAIEPEFLRAKKDTETGWVFVGIGAGATLGGILIAVLAPDTRNSALGVAPWFTASSGGLSVSGAW
jgi:tetratricopeptide (TPR) repeat protein